MAIPFDRLDCTDLQRYIHQQNVVCSEKLLAALKEAHPELDPTPPKPEPKPLPLPPIPNTAIQQAAAIAFPDWVGAVKRIQLAVCDEYGVTFNDMCSARRSRKIVRPRQVAMYLCKTLTNRSLPEIGRRFGGRDHTTALHAVRKIEQMCAIDDEMRGRVSKLTEAIAP